MWILICTIGGSRNLSGGGSHPSSGGSRNLSGNSDESNTSVYSPVNIAGQLVPCTYHQFNRVSYRYILGS